MPKAAPAAFLLLSYLALAVSHLLLFLLVSHLISVILTRLTGTGGIRQAGRGNIERLDNGIECCLRAWILRSATAPRCSLTASRLALLS